MTFVAALKVKRLLGIEVSGHYLLRGQITEVAKRREPVVTFECFVGIPRRNAEYRQVQT
jgi:hypothetical protein